MPTHKHTKTREPGFCDENDGNVSLSLYLYLYIHNFCTLVHTTSNLELLALGTKLIPHLALHLFVTLLTDPNILYLNLSTLNKTKLEALPKKSLQVVVAKRHIFNVFNILVGTCSVHVGKWCGLPFKTSILFISI